VNIAETVILLLNIFSEYYSVSVILKQ